MKGCEWTVQLFGDVLAWRRDTSRKKGNEKRRRKKPRGLTLHDLLLAQLPQLLHIRRLARNHALSNLKPARDSGAVRNRVRRRLGVDLDDADAGVLRPAVVLAVAQVADPGLEVAGIVFAHDVAVRDDGGFAGDGGPFARRVQEGDVDGWVGV